MFYTCSLHACLECQRRKIRCDGKQPCNRCQSSRSRRRCVYEQHRQRLVPSRKSLEELSRSLEECRSVLRRLYPNHDVSHLLSLSRQELCDLLNQPAQQETAELSPAPPSPNDDQQHPKELEQMPAQNSQWDEERRERDPLPAEADDVNALSLTMDKQATSYLGASSVKVALTVMLQIQPQLQLLLASQSSPDASGDENARSKIPPFRAAIKSTKKQSPIPWTYKGQALVDAYFKRVHVLTPLVDEASFRKHYNEGRRCDAPWLSLLNMVFATSSVMSTPSSNLSHIKYYNQAIEHIHLSAFGSSHIETIHALGLLGGYYLHYINRPNMANAIVGATLRMATALGLHREPPPEESQSDPAAVEARRRTWWTLFCLDTWGTTTLGRPSFGRWGPAINIQPPELVTENEEHDSAQFGGIMPLLENIKFCKIATKIQDMLAVTPLLKYEDRNHLDSLLVDWHNNLPWLLQSTEPCVEPLHLARSVMIWRYWNLRMLLYRPVLLTLASKGQLPMSEQDVAAVEICQGAARETVDSVSKGWMRQQMSGWNAVWFLYQAAMIPLVSILWQPDSPAVVEWRAQIESTLELFEAMKDWSLTARRSRDVVSRLLEASSKISNTGQGVAPSDDASGFWGVDDGTDTMGSTGYSTGDIVNMLDQDWPWNMDLDGLVWGQQIPLLEEDNLDIDAGIDEGVMGVDYLSLATEQSDAIPPP
ncbi:N-terminal binuclear Zn cluster-containing protein [Trichoderma citrinoviride]|uniref:N-terminal binuclear Zn cluster-containing protein n=1 Tax=Trichoderma citrinoviride TaxID=58853 RepID=A0A2T4BMC6_9HYPO|nr:N-terminal binuclear Zn cluster-containing protein [Trichoderma citrinoviride]PTB70474.1 N-terminal binuclear Zn cluster-containing protein [Trichoderma citrinoviride]